MRQVFRQRRDHRLDRYRHHRWRRSHNPGTGNAPCPCCRPSPLWCAASRNVEGVLVRDGISIVAYVLGRAERATVNTYAQGRRTARPSPLATSTTSPRLPKFTVAVAVAVLLSKLERLAVGVHSVVYDAGAGRRDVEVLTLDEGRRRLPPLLVPPSSRRPQTGPATPPAGSDVSPTLYPPLLYTARHTMPYSLQSRQGSARVASQT